jgi:hypothetical protein
MMRKFLARVRLCLYRWRMDMLLDDYDTIRTQWPRTPTEQKRYERIRRDVKHMHDEIKTLEEMME